MNMIQCGRFKIGLVITIMLIVLIVSVPMFYIIDKTTTPSKSDFGVLKIDNEGGYQIAKNTKYIENAASGVYLYTLENNDILCYNVVQNVLMWRRNVANNRVIIADKKRLYITLYDKLLILEAKTGNAIIETSLPGYESWVAINDAKGYVYIMNI